MIYNNSEIKMKVKIVSFIFVFFINLNEITSLTEDESTQILQKLFGNSLLNAIGGYVEENNMYNVSQCLNDIGLWKKSLLKKDGIWAQKMADSAGKLPPGLLTLNIHSYGQFDECLSIRKEFKDSATINGKYCLAKFALLPSSSTDSKLKQMYKFYNATEENHQISPRLLNFDKFGRPSLVMAVCMPHSCNTDEIRPIIDYILASFDINLEKPLVTIPENECVTSDPPVWTPKDWGALSFFIIFAVIIIMSTAYDLYSKHKKKIDNDRCHKLLISFSIWTNTSNIINRSKNSKSIRCIHGIRAISLLWVILGHRYTFYSFMPVMNYIDFFPWLEAPGSVIALAAVLAVDTFFTLSGLLVAFVSFKKLKPKECFNFPLMYLHRYLRLTPALAAFIFFQTTLYRFLGDGPLWNKFMNDVVKRCEANWWTAILYVQNYVDPNNMCIPQTWYLCCDFHLFILSPIVIYPLLKWKRLGWANVIFWTLVAQITTFVIVYEFKWFGGTSTLKGTEKRSEYFYYVTHTRATPWLLGFIGGYLLHLSAQKKIKIHPAGVIAGWLAAFAILAAVIFGLIPLQKLDHKFSYAEDTMYNAFARTGWALAITWMVMACTHGYGGPINWFLSWEIWEILGKLSYSTYLVHIHTQYIYTANIRAPFYLADFPIIVMFFADVLFVFLVGYLLAISFEFPFAALERVIFYPKPKLDQPIERKVSVENEKHEA